MTINLIVAHGKNLEIGHNNQLLWHLPEDLKRFKTITSGHTVVMGRKTFESIGKPLPNRVNVVLSKTADTGLKWYRVKEGQQGVRWMNSLELLLDWYKDREIFIIGGAEVYKAFLPYADRLYITLVEGIFPEADTFMPDYFHLLDDNWTSDFEGFGDKCMYIRHEKKDIKKM